MNNKQNDLNAQATQFLSNLKKPAYSGRDVSAPAEPALPSASTTRLEGRTHKKELKSQRKQLLLRPTTCAELNRIAEAQDVSFNDLVNRILDTWVQDQSERK